MKFIEDWKRTYEAQDDEDKLVMLFATLLGGAVGVMVVIGLVAVLIALAKAALPLVLVVVVAYLLGIKFLGWPVPAFIKKLYK